MAKPKRSGDTYGTFLRTIKQIEGQEDTTQQSQAPPSGSIERSRKVLSYLAGRDGPQPVADLLQVSGLTLTDFYAAITTLQEVGLIAMNGEPGQEQAELTTAGRYVARME